MNKTFEAQSHGFRTGCLRFAGIVTDHHARLASGRWSDATRRDSHPQGHYQRFQISFIFQFMSSSPFAKLLGANTLILFNGYPVSISCHATTLRNRMVKLLISLRTVPRKGRLRTDNYKYQIGYRKPRHRHILETHQIQLSSHLFLPTQSNAKPGPPN